MQAPSARAEILIPGGSLDVIDDEPFAGTPGGREFQTELLL